MKQLLKNFAFVGTVIAAALIVILSAPTVVRAASDKEAVEELSDKMCGYEYILLLSDWFDAEDYRNPAEVELTKKEMARAAAFVVDCTSKKKHEYNDGMWEYCVVSNEEIKASSKRLFGKAVGKKNLGTEMECEICDVIQQEVNGKAQAQIHYFCYETETNYDVISTEITKSGKGYKVFKKVYLGYWGMDDGETYNYTIEYNVKKSSKSDLGFVISGMVVQAVETD